MCAQRVIEPDRPGIDLWREADLGIETPLKLASTEPAPFDQSVDACTAPGGHHDARRTIDDAIRAAVFQESADPAFRGGNTRLEIRRSTDRIIQSLGTLAEDIGRRRVAVDQGIHLNSDQTVEARRLKQDIKNVNLACQA
jgi:hypothetical protein